MFPCNHVIEAEIMAIIQGLKNIPDSISRNPVVVKCDNKTIVHHMSAGLFFRDSTKINRLLIAELVSLSEKFNIKWSHVKGHSGIENNQKVDSATRKVILESEEL